MKRPGRDVNHPPPSSAELKGVELYLCSATAVFTASYMANFTFNVRIKSSKSLRFHYDVDDDDEEEEEKYSYVPLSALACFFSVSSWSVTGQ